MLMSRWKLNRCSSSNIKAAAHSILRCNNESLHYNKLQYLAWQFNVTVSARLFQLFALAVRRPRASVNKLIWCVFSWRSPPLPPHRSSCERWKWSARLHEPANRPADGLMVPGSVRVVLAVGLNQSNGLETLLISADLWCAQSRPWCFCSPAATSPVFVTAAADWS